MRVLIFGDSITQGFWDTEGGWVQRLRKGYDEKQITNYNDEQPTLFNLGVSADFTSSVLARFDSETIARKREETAFVFAIGINDAVVSNGEPMSTPEKYAEELKLLLAKTKAYPYKVLFVGMTPVDETLTAPTAWGDYVYTNDRILQFQAVLQGFCEQNQLPFIEVFHDFQAENAKTNLLADGLHPNNAGHELIAKLVRPGLEKLIG